MACDQPPLAQQPPPPRSLPSYLSERLHARQLHSDGHRHLKHANGLYVNQRLNRISTNYAGVNMGQSPCSGYNSSGHYLFLLLCIAAAQPGADHYVVLPGVAVHQDDPPGQQHGPQGDTRSPRKPRYTRVDIGLHLRTRKSW